MLRIGVHVSVAGGLEKAVDRAREKGCHAFQIFTTNPRSWRSRPIPAESASLFSTRRKEYDLYPAISHMPYLPNLASPREDVYSKSVQALTDELVRCQLLGIPYVVAHLGSHLGAGEKNGRERIAEALERAIADSESDVLVLLENSAGTRNSMGSTFNEIASIIESLPEQSGRLGVCLDTCHLFAAGYDLRTPRALEGTLEELESCIDPKRIKLVHLNDCRSSLGSHLDRHEHIGLGQIGLEGFRSIVSHPFLRERAMILETPQDSRRDDRGNLEVVRSLASDIE